ncbi:Malonyl CoA-acyl carrier protein transacylase [hydrothermal vent metagenome]|uniref:[acyl-carrier-protein] S-malonyltransferase n=1 Tax=hydrothermal vent metagenome TaxID=652676 RepID=A0A3B0U4S1_9ZZZZ
MTIKKKKALVICPGRGSYNKGDLGYLRRYHRDKARFVAAIDVYRNEHDQISVSELDGAQNYSLSLHTRGDNASALIYACAYADFLSIDRDRYDIVAVTGNSMGWYIALACAGATTALGALKIINTMGTLMHNSLIGGQLIYPVVDENWCEIDGRRAELMALMAQINQLAGHQLYISIELGGLLVFAGTEKALEALQKQLKPEQSRFPLRLKNHAAFHTPLQAPVSDEGKAALPLALFNQPAIAMIDGRGHLWPPHVSDPGQLWDYTLGEQVVTTYDFTAAIKVGLCEFAPDCLIILGPGNSLGAAVAQSMIAMNWHDLSAKTDFIQRQKSSPFVLSMGLPDQRNSVTKPFSKGVLR